MQIYFYLSINISIGTTVSPFFLSMSEQHLQTSSGSGTKAQHDHQLPFVSTTQLIPLQIKVLFKNANIFYLFLLPDSNLPWCKCHHCGPALLHMDPHQTLYFLLPLYFLPNFAVFFVIEATLQFFKYKSGQDRIFSFKMSASFPCELVKSNFHSVSYHAPCDPSLLSLTSQYTAVLDLLTIQVLQGLNYHFPFLKLLPPSFT